MQQAQPGGADRKLVVSVDDIDDEGSSTFEDEEEEASPVVRRFASPRKDAVLPPKVNVVTATSPRATPVNNKATDTLLSPTATASPTTTTTTKGAAALEVRETPRIRVSEDELPALLQLGPELGRGAFSLVFQVG